MNMKSEEYENSGHVIKSRGEMDKNNYKQGKWIHYFPNGQIFKVENYKDDELDGEFIRYHENGNCAFIRNWKKGNRDGIVKEYYENGQLLEVGEYINGKYNIINWWEEDGKQTLTNGTGMKIEYYGSEDQDVYEQHFINGKMIEERKIKGWIYIGFIPQDESQN